MALSGKLPDGRPLYKIVAPSREYQGTTMGVKFQDGVGYTTDQAIANRLQWDFHYETQPVDKVDTGRAVADYELHAKMMQGGIISKASALAAFGGVNYAPFSQPPSSAVVDAHLTRLETALDRAERREYGKEEAWLRGRVREITELVKLG
jgi:hypothetical protein